MFFILVNWLFCFAFLLLDARIVLYAILFSWVVILYRAVCKTKPLRKKARMIV